MKITHEAVANPKGPAGDPPAKSPAETIVEEAVEIMEVFLAGAADEVGGDPAKAVEFLKELRELTREEFIRPIADQPGCHQDLCDDQLIAFMTLVNAAGMGAAYGVASLAGQSALKALTVPGDMPLSAKRDPAKLAEQVENDTFANAENSAAMTKEAIEKGIHTPDAVKEQVKQLLLVMTETMLSAPEKQREAYLDAVVFGAAVGAAYAVPFSLGVGALRASEPAAA